MASAALNPEWLLSARLRQLRFLSRLKERDLESLLMILSSNQTHPQNQDRGLICILNIWSSHPFSLVKYVMLPLISVFYCLDLNKDSGKLDCFCMLVCPIKFFVIQHKGKKVTTLVLQKLCQRKKVLRINSVP